jgi:hypothetical protein
MPATVWKERLQHYGRARRFSLPASVDMTCRARSMVHTDGQPHVLSMQCARCRSVAQPALAIPSRSVTLPEMGNGTT